MSAPSAGVAEEATASGSYGAQLEEGRVRDERSRLMPFVVISLSYCLYTITDGAVRMIVLLHAFNLGFSAMMVAVMFTLYEVAGVVTNLLAGLAGARWGIRTTLLTGLCLQVVGVSLLFWWSEKWERFDAIVFITFAQCLCGIAKDLTKLGGKSVAKLVTSEEKQTQLFKMVAFITGLKNSLKGMGYFVGAFALTYSYELALWVQLAILFLAMPGAIFFLSDDLGKARSSNAGWAEICSPNPQLSILSLARLFLFMSRDMWFEVPLPFFLRSPSCGAVDGSVPCSGTDSSACSGGAVCGPAGTCVLENEGGGCGGLGLDRASVGAFLALYIILYGNVQTLTPQLVIGPLNQSPPNKLVEVLWGMVNCVPPLLLAVLMGLPQFRALTAQEQLYAVAAGIALFGIIFAINSSVHSYLVMRYAPEDKVAQSVGFYYMANAGGRLIGTLVSGALYSYVGDNNRQAMAACFLAGVAASLAAALVTTRIEGDDEEGLMCGPVTCVQRSKDSA